MQFFIQTELAYRLPFSADTVNWMTGRHLACRTFDAGMLVVTIWLELCTSYVLQLSPPLPTFLAPIKYRMDAFWYRLTQVHLERGV